MSPVYVICTTPRTGSTLLCAGLAQTRLAGTPAEFFDPRPEGDAYWRYRYGISEESDFVDAIVKATRTPNGVFGTKLHWTARIHLVRALRESLNRSGFDLRHRTLDDLLQAKFSIVRYIWLRRRNKAAQGISHFLAARTDVWEIPSGHDRALTAESEVEFDFRRIHSCILHATEQDRAWSAYFVRHRLKPLLVSYEQLVAAYDPTLRRVLEHLDIGHADLPVAVPQLQRLADARSLEWEER